MKNIFITFIIIVSSLFYVYGQSIYPSVVSPSGNNFYDSNNKLSWTLGELAVKTINSGNNTISQGFQQPDYNNGNFIKKVIDNVDFTLFPNPVKDNLYIYVESEKKLDLNIEIINIVGNKINAIMTYSTDYYKINMSDLSKGIYVVKITVNNDSVPTSKQKRESFRIIKI